MCIPELLETKLRTYFRWGLPSQSWTAMRMQEAPATSSDGRKSDMPQLSNESSAAGPKKKSRHIHSLWVRCLHRGHTLYRCKHNATTDTQQLGLPAGAAMRWKFSDGLPETARTVTAVFQTLHTVPVSFTRRPGKHLKQTCAAVTLKSCCAHRGSWRNQSWAVARGVYWCVARFAQGAIRKIAYR